MKRSLISTVVIMMTIAVFWATPVGAISEARETAIRDNCESIRESLRALQKTDSKMRVYLGKYYDGILNNFIVPLNVRLVENNLSNAELIENQNEIADVKILFANEFVSYQQSLEELILVDCKVEPEKFYEELEIVRQKRKIVEQDTLRIRSLFSEHLNLAEQLKGKI